MTTIPAGQPDERTRPIYRNRPGKVPKWERFLFVIVLLTGGFLMWIAGQAAMQMPRTWQINDTNMDSKLNPNDVYAQYHKDSDFRLAPIRTDIPDLLATAANPGTAPNAFLPPSAIEFKAPRQIATTTPFRLNSDTITATVTAAAATAASVTPSVTAQPTSSATPTLTPPPSSKTPLLTSTPRRSPTRTPTRTPLPTNRPANTATPTRVSLPGATQTPTVTLTAPPTSTATYTATSTPTATATSTPTPTPTDTTTSTITPTPAFTPTPTPAFTPTTQAIGSCAISGSSSYIIPANGCLFSYDTAAQGAIFSLNMVGSGNVSVSWFGLLENQTSGTCAAQSSNLTPGISLTNIAVVKSTTTALTINNSNNKPLTVQITVSDWISGGCQ